MGRITAGITAFNSGELAPKLHGRVDTERYRNGVARMFNFLPEATGGVKRRTGSRFVAATKGDAAGILIPFIFNTDQAYIVEATDHAFRFYRSKVANPPTPPGQLVIGAVPVEIATPYALADLPLLKWTQSADTLYLVHPNHAPRKLQRITDTQWRIVAVDLKDGPYGRTYSRVSGVGVAITASAINGDNQTITAVPNNISIVGAANNGQGAIRLTTATNHNFLTGDPVRVSGVTGVAGANGDWVVTKIGATTLDLQNSTFAGVYGGGGTVDANIFSATDVGRFIRKLDPAAGGPFWGHARIVSVTNHYTAIVNILEPFSITSASQGFRLGALSETTGWPYAVTFHEERLWFAATKTQPNTIWGSVTGDFENFAPTDTFSSTSSIVDSDAVTLNIAADEIDALRWIKGLRALAGASGGGEFAIQASSLNEAITPANANYRPASARGAAHISPARIDNGLVFIDRNRNRLYEFAYSVDSDYYASEELSVLADHLTRRGIGGLAYQAAPDSVFWMNADDGSLIGFSYMKSQQVMAWHSHAIAGEAAKVIAIAAIPGTTQSELWMIVERQINGATRRYVEYLDYDYMPADANDKARAFYVDSGLTYQGAPTNIITGLDHLIGESVTILADGAVHPNRIVDNAGAVTLDYPVSVAQIGLGFTSILQSLPLDIGAQDGSALAKPKRVSRIGIRFLDTLGAKIGADEQGPLEEVLFRPGQSPMNQSAPLFTGVKMVAFPKGWDREAKVAVIQDRPLPCSILALAPVLTTMEG